MHESSLIIIHNFSQVDLSQWGCQTALVFPRSGWPYELQGRSQQFSPMLFGGHCNNFVQTIILNSIPLNLEKTTPLSPYKCAIFLMYVI